MSKTDIDSIPLDAFRGLLQLQQIDLSDNRFVTVPESLSLVGKTLEYLTFNNNPIVELNDDSFVGMNNNIILGTDKTRTCNNKLFNDNKI